MKKIRYQCRTSYKHFHDKTIWSTFTCVVHKIWQKWSKMLTVYPLSIYSNSRCRWLIIQRGQLQKLICHKPPPPMKNLNNKHCINYHLWKAESDLIKLVPNLWSWHKKHGTHDTQLRIKKAGIPQYQLNMSQWIVQGSITHFIWQ